MADISTTVVTTIARTVFGNKRIVIANVQFGGGSDVFAKEGVPFTAEKLGLGSIEFISFVGAKAVYAYDYTNKVIMAYLPHATPGAAVPLITCDDAIIADTLRVFAVGTR